MTLFLLSCSLGQAIPTPTPTLTLQPTGTSTSSPIPFQRYGETLRDVTYCTPDDLPQTLDVYFPQAGGPWPAVVYIHGGGWRYGDKSEAAGMAAGMTAQGYLVASINYRLYPTGKFPDMIEDAKCAIRFLRHNAGAYNLDPGRIAAVGVSAGGHLAALLGTTDESAGWDVGEYLDQSSRVQAVVTMSAPLDLKREFPTADTTFREVGAGQDLAAASPITYVSAGDPPFLLIQGDRDELVPAEQGQLMYDRLTQANVPVQLVIVRNGRHSLTAPDGSATPTLGEISQTMLDFLRRKLK
ncbi:MAG TPA: alpha/beta hydrolase [Anaerolineales bacterium]|nr:alpha/beta hydrolase [Anaerolineales bacterium]